MDAGVEGIDRAAAAGESGNAAAAAAALAEPDSFEAFRTDKGVNANEAEDEDEDEDENADEDTAAAAAGEVVTMERCEAATGERAKAIGVMAGGATSSGRRAGEAAASITRER